MAKECASRGESGRNRGGRGRGRRRGTGGNSSNSREKKSNTNSVATGQEKKEKDEGQRTYLSLSLERVPELQLPLLSILDLEDEEELERIGSMLEEELHELLVAPSDVFWSTVCLSAKLSAAVDRFLQVCPRPQHTIDGSSMPHLPARLHAISEKVLRVMLRLATPPRDLDPLVYSKEMQDKDLLSIAQLLDCCSLYYVYRDRTVAQLVQKAMENRPELLKSELPKTLNSVSDVVTELSTRLRHGSEEDSGWKDAMAYLSDIVCTIALFFRAAPRHVCRPLSGAKVLLESLVSVYNEVLPASEAGQSSVVGAAIVSLFCTLMRNSILYPIQHAMKPHIVVGGVRRLLSLVEILRKCDGRLRCDVARCMSLADEVSKITCKEYERELDALTNELEDSCARADANVNERMPSCSSSSSSSLDRQTTQDREKLLVQISAVQEVLPHLGEGFIAHCLLEYHGQAEAVIDRVLTGELSPALQNLDQSMALQPLGATSSQANKPRAVERLYDGDQFDVNTNDSFDMSRVSRGKKFVGKSKIQEELNNMEDRNEIKSFISTFDDRMPDFVEEGEYDDEYDDSYDNFTALRESDSNDATVDERENIVSVPCFIEEEDPSDGNNDANRTGHSTITGRGGRERDKRGGKQRSSRAKHGRKQKARDKMARGL